MTILLLLAPDLSVFTRHVMMHGCRMILLLRPPQLSVLVCHCFTHVAFNAVTSLSFLLPVIVIIVLIAVHERSIVTVLIAVHELQSLLCHFILTFSFTHFLSMRSHLVLPMFHPSRLMIGLCSGRLIISNGTCPFSEVSDLVQHQFE